MNLNKRLNTAQGPLDLQVDFGVNPGETLALYGPSGVGKTSILRMIAGLMKPDGGSIEVGGKMWFDSGKRVNIAVQKRQTGFLFQDYALFPHLSVRDNIAFAQRNSKAPKAVDELLDHMGLTQLADQRPHSLSGGQQQRTALARALAQNPQLLLLDEPLSALDEATRYDLQTRLLQLRETRNLTILLVSHSPNEILRLADHVIEIDQGRITRHGTPTDLFVNQPLSGKIHLQGRIVQIEQQGFVQVLHVLCGQELVKVVETGDATYQVGEQVGVIGKAFGGGVV